MLPDDLLNTNDLVNFLEVEYPAHRFNQESIPD